MDELKIDHEHYDLREDHAYYQAGDIEGDKFIMLVHRETFWPDGEGRVEKYVLASAKARGVKKIFINDVTTGVVYFITMDEAFKTGGEEFAVFSKHNIRKGTEDDMRK
jgi:hypothetical protein